MANRVRAICFDFGDTLSDQGTELRDAAGTMVHVELLAGAREVLRELARRGYPLALVVDGERASLDNVLREHGLEGLFGATVVSEAVGVAKPHPLMFERALRELGVTESDYGRTIMVGNRLERDVKGAHALGMVAVWLDWSPRYRKAVAEPAEAPDHVIRRPAELLELVERLEGAGA
jgi:HAD superfamily hydrolase (TIGR01549 family)